MKWTDRIGRRVKLRDLHIALAVAEAGSMTRAAEDLAVSYPVVSKTISELEHTLGVKLFDRSISGVQPTHYGRALLKSGVAVFDEMRKALQQIDFIKQPDGGELRIGSSIVTDAGLLPAIMERFSQDFPRAGVHVLPENIAIQQYDNLRDRKVELVFGRLPTPMNEPDLVVSHGCWRSTNDRGANGDGTRRQSHSDALNATASTRAAPRCHAFVPRQ